MGIIFHMKYKFKKKKERAAKLDLRKSATRSVVIIFLVLKKIKKKLLQKFSSNYRS